MVVSIEDGSTNSNPPEMLLPVTGCVPSSSCFEQVRETPQQHRLLLFFFFFPLGFLPQLENKTLLLNLPLPSNTGLREIELELRRNFPSPDPALVALEDANQASERDKTLVLPIWKV